MVTLQELVQQTVQGFGLDLVEIERSAGGLLRVFIDAEGSPQQIEIRQSSGYERLDQQALEAVRRWRFVPGKRNGVPEAMWNIVPINFVLE